MDDIILLEENSKIKKKSKSNRTYKCPYCNERHTRYDLVYHVQDEHEDLIPQGYTAARVVFNYVNKKENGRCIVCKKETKWNEDTWKYERLCDDPKCTKKYTEYMKGNMMNVYNKPHLLNDDKQQNKMLNNRKISGKYKFKDGGIRTYVGSYELKALEFFDKVLNVHSKDIMTPGPTIEYEYKGEKHFWITDQYYIPANLVIDEKDGGKNPNTRNMAEYRAKQKAKEDAIRNQGKFNYLRLTDNDFQQLMYVLAEIKQQLLDNSSNDMIIEINESVVGAAIPPLGGPDSAYVVPCMMNNVFVKTMYSTDRSLDNLYDIRDNKITKVSRDELKGFTHSVLKYTKSDWCDRIKAIQEDMDNQVKIIDNDYFYKKITGKNVICKEQISMDDCFEEVLDKITEGEERLAITNATLEHEIAKLDENYYVPEIPLMTNKEKSDARELLQGTINLEVAQDINGYFIRNIATNDRSKYYEQISDIPDYIPGLLR